MQNTIKKDEPEMSIMNGKIVEDPLTPADYQFINHYKKIKYGELHNVIIRNGCPVRVEESMKSTKFIDMESRRKVDGIYKKF